MGHEPSLVLLEVRLFVNPEIMQVRVLESVFVQQRLPPLLRPVAEHLFIQRTCPPLDHAPFINQSSGEFRKGAALSVDLAVNHLFTADAEDLALLDQHLDVPWNGRINELVADLADIRRQQLRVAREKAHVSLVDDEMKIVDLHRVAVPVSPKETDGLQREFSFSQLAHERSVEDLLLPAAPHLLTDSLGVGPGLIRAQSFAPI